MPKFIIAIKCLSMLGTIRFIDGVLGGFFVLLKNVIMGCYVNVNCSFALFYAS